MFHFESRVRNYRLRLIVMVSIFSFSIMSVAVLPPKVMAQDTIAAPTDGVADEGGARLFFTEPPVDELIDTQGGEAGLENEIDTFAYTPNFFPEYSGIESAAVGSQVLYLPSVATSGQEDVARVQSVSAVKTFYVDCASGNDALSGLTSGEAWRSVSRANKATLMPGDQLLFKRGCSWNGTLQAKWTGTASQPITIGAYGSGELPKIQNGNTYNVRITGNYQIIQDIHSTLSAWPNPDPNCRNQPRGWKAGFAFDNTASYNTLRTSKATRLTIGVWFHNDTHHNKVLNNTITDNQVLQILNSTTSHGATGVSLHGRYNEIGRNYFANNRAWCTYTGLEESISIELYEASDSNIHHNTAYNDRVFIELGSTSAWQSANNTLAYNVHVTKYSAASMGARFVVTRGYGHQFGPVLNTQLFNNVIFLTGAGAKGVACQYCGNDILTMRNNVLWANDEPFSSDRGFIESNNIFWSNDGSPSIQWRGLTKSPSTQIANPQFVDPWANNFRLKSGSPAINRGIYDVVSLGYTLDLGGSPVPTGGAVDVGSFEFQ